MRERSARLEAGVLVIDGTRRLLLAGDYPYYRDAPERWPGKLAQLRAAGLEVVTFYIPWRHHLVVDEGGHQRFVFSGGPGDSRNVLGFLEQVSAAGLLAIAKPGPFVHAEIQLGGLPDWASPSVSPGLAPALSARGAALRSQGLALPSAVDPDFLRGAREWLRSVASQVLAGRLYPLGPLLGVQLGNEGLYSDASLPLDAVDYSRPALQRFRRFLARKYRAIDALNAAHGTSLRSFGEVQPASEWRGLGSLAACLDWAEWSWRYLGEVLEEWGSALGTCMKLLNLPPPARPGAHLERQGARLDAWLSRVQPRRWRGLHYGFTSWTGNALEDDGALLRYVLAARRARGPNLEENWGFCWSDPRCLHPISPTYHAVLALAAGATGFSVYPACETDAWGPSIRVDLRHLPAHGAEVEMYEPPYGSQAPITSTGERGRKFEALSLLTHFFRHEGEALLGCAPCAGVAWGLYTPYSAVGAWEPPRSERYKGLRLPQPATEALERFAADCLASGVDFQLVDLETVPAAELATHPRLLLAGGFYMSEPVQEKLATYVEQGGVLVMLGESPLYNEQLQWCELLQERVFGHQFLNRESSHYLEELACVAACRPLAPPEEAEPLLTSAAGAHGYRVQREQGLALYLDIGVTQGVTRWVLEKLGLCGLAEAAAAQQAVIFEHAAQEVTFLFVLGRGPGGLVSCRVQHQPLEVLLTEHGCAVVKIQQGRLAGCFVKGLNELSGQGSAVRIRYGGEEIGTDVPCDLSVIQVEGRWCARTAPSTAVVQVHLPARPHPQSG